MQDTGPPVQLRVACRRMLPEPIHLPTLSVVAADHHVERLLVLEWATRERRTCLRWTPPNARYSPVAVPASPLNHIRPSVRPVYSPYPICELSQAETHTQTSKHWPRFSAEMEMEMEMEMRMIEKEASKTPA